MSARVEYRGAQNPTVGWKQCYQVVNLTLGTVVAGSGVCASYVAGRSTYAVTSPSFALDAGKYDYGFQEGYNIGGETPVGRIFLSW